MSYLVVLPSIFPRWTAECLATCRIPEERLLVVDNTVRNLGVAASWNLGARRVLDEELDWLVVLSAGVRFGTPGGLDFVAALDEHVGAVAVEAGADSTGERGFGWHLIAFARETFEAVGLFDENFFPAYREDLDFSYRIQLARGRWNGVPLWPKVDVEGTLKGFAHGITLARVAVDDEALARYYEAKWGGPSQAERYVRPFDDPAAGIDYWPARAEVPT